MLMLGVVILTLAWQSYRGYGQTPDADAVPVEFTIDEGESFSSVAERLDDAGVVASAFWFKVTASMTDRMAALKPGTFTILSGDNYDSLLNTLTVAQSDEVTITIPEGSSLEDIGALVMAKFEVTQDEWDRLTGVNTPFTAHAFIVSSGRPSGVDLEGYLFPDTYRFFADATGEEIVEHLLDTMADRVNALGTPSGDASGMTIHEVLSLASIVEKEVRTENSMKNVADIFLKRLDINMPLQSDATINYIIDGDNPSPLYSDLEVESPYNTYRNPGLPPGPISSPGLRAITAVLQPISNPYFYFLTTDEGEIYYAETYEEHLENKNAYLK